MENRIVLATQGSQGIVALRELFSLGYRIEDIDINSLVNNLPQKINDDSTDLYEVGSFINNSLSLKDKLDFISCIYEVAYADNNMHFIERHIIKQIINILNINKDELKKIKKDLL